MKLYCKCGKAQMLSDRTIVWLRGPGEGHAHTLRGCPPEPTAKQLADLASHVFWLGAGLRLQRVIINAQCTGSPTN